VPGILQEKFQVDNPQQRNDDAQSGWVNDKSARAKKNPPNSMREGRPGGDYDSRYMGNAVQYASLPPGMDIEDQEMTDQRRFTICMGGESDVSADWNAEAVKNGFKRKPMRATDDEYSNAHVDAFYDEIKVDGDVGFTERNNVLDRM
jgi:hypothetical protein